ncbi:hypothetical protein [Streptomyces sp. NPDC059455]|uniref:hypothetical protein n=1 Tax=Streptomyces sp. NPDC059455 TaxID=3346837 RepID=UPI0036B932FA
MRESRTRRDSDEFELRTAAVRMGMGVRHRDLLERVHAAASMSPDEGRLATVSRAAHVGGVEAVDINTGIAGVVPSRTISCGNGWIKLMSRAVREPGRGA